jgi:hypothetical protein
MRGNALNDAREGLKPAEKAMSQWDKRNPKTGDEGMQSRHGG